jgi:hypothetical protein
MKNHLALAGLLALLAACSSEGGSPSSKSDWGTGLNTVDRKYPKTAAQVHDAAVTALGKLDIKVDKDRHDAMGSEIVAERADKSKVMINVRALDEKSSQAYVRVDPGDAQMAKIVHEKIAEELGMGAAKGALLGGNTEDRTYDSSLKACADAAERSAKSLGYTVTGKESHDTWAQVDARTADSTPVRFRMDRADDRTRVTFTAGTGKTEDSKTMLTRMREEFERQIAGHAK